MGEYKLLEHTADVRIYAKGHDLPDLFIAALHGLCSVIRHSSDTAPEELQKIIDIEITSLDSSSLIVEFLSECLSYMHAEKAIIPKVEFHRLTETRLKAELHGYYVDGFDEDVKAVTYHNAEIIQKEDFFECTVLLDI